jgi:hypothetical protein
MDPGLSPGKIKQFGFRLILAQPLSLNPSYESIGLNHLDASKH